MTRLPIRWLAFLLACMLLASSPDWAAHAQRATAGAQAELAGARLTQVGGGRLHGVVRDENGRAVGGITLTITGDALPKPRTAVTDADGRFDVESLPAGPVVLTCEAPGFVPWRREAVTIASSRATSLDITMRRVTVTAGGSKPTPRPPAGGGGTRGGETPSAVQGTEPEPEPPATTPRHELLQQIDDYLARMDVGQVGFNAPATMRIGETTPIRLVVSPSQSIEEIAEQLRGLPGELQSAEVRIAPEMEAVLTGQQFSITAITPRAQVVSRQVPTEWRWEVSPTAPGAHRLHLVLNARILESARTLRTFEQTIDVNVPPLGQRISGFVGDNWQWLWATAVVPLAGWLWSRRSSVRRQRRVSE